MIGASDLEHLAKLQRGLRELLEPLPEALLYRQFHPDLSPLGWHLGHCAFIESFWLREELLGDAAATAEWHGLYFPDQSYKPARGAALPPKQRLFEWARQLQEENLAQLAALPASLAEHPLVADGYLARFLCGHHAQHLETMRMALAQQALQAAASPAAGQPLTAQPPAPDSVLLPAGRYRIGRAEAVFDNERPAFTADLAACRLGRRPVSNAEFLGFIEAGMYTRPEAWTAAGQDWLAEARPRAPALWRHGEAGWYEITPTGAAALQPQAPVSGLNWYEADAYARWAGGRLPHEYEWEAAAKADLIEGRGEVWEWCGNAFHPYPGFRAFPYRGYSQPWFDDAHYVLRGGGRHSEPCIRTPTFRNFYTRDKRHIFAGCRLAYDYG